MYSCKVCRDPMKKKFLRCSCQLNTEILYFYICGECKCDEKNLVKLPDDRSVCRECYNKFMHFQKKFSLDTQ